MHTKLEWDERKNVANKEKHGLDFSEAQYAFLDPNRVIAVDVAHSKEEKRYYCFGKIQDAIVTVRFTYKKQSIRIFGAGFWRKGEKIYETKNQISQ